MQPGRRCPVGLLDALDNSDKRAVGEEEHLVGEEKVRKLASELSGCTVDFICIMLFLRNGESFQFKVCHLGNKGIF